MKKNRKKILFVVSIIFLAAAVVVLVLLLQPIHKEYIQIERVNDLPMVVYEKLEKIEEGSAIRSLNLCQIGDAPQKIAPEVWAHEVDVNGRKILYSLKGDDVFEQEVYLFDNMGVKQLLTKKAFDYGISQDGVALFYRRFGKGELYISEYTSDGQLKEKDKISIGDKEYSFEMNEYANFIVFTKNSRAAQEVDFDKDDNPYDFNWADIYIYSNGEMERIAKKAFLSNMKQSISNNGAVLFLADANKQTMSGTLYLKEIGKESVEVTGKSLARFAISNDGSLIATITGNRQNEHSLFYKFSGSNSKTVNNVLNYLISDDSKTLVYGVETSGLWENDLYSVNENNEPVLLAQNVSILLEISEDGKHIAYISNLDKKNHSGDLYIVKEGEEPLLIDTEVGFSYVTNYFNVTSINMYNDGSTIAYLKNFDSNTLRGDLYVKQEGKEPQKIEEEVSVGFGFFE